MTLASRLTPDLRKKVKFDSWKEKGGEVNWRCRQLWVMRVYLVGGWAEGGEKGAEAEEGKERGR